MGNGEWGVGSREIIPLTPFLTPLLQSAIRNPQSYASCLFHPAHPEQIRDRRLQPELLPYLAKRAEISVFVEEADDDYPEPVFAIDAHRFDGVFVGSVNNVDMHPAPPPVKKGANTVELRLPSMELPYNAYFLSLKAYTKNDGPDWKDPADIHNQMYQFDVVTDRLIHGLMRFDAEWRGAIINGPKREPVTLR